MLFDGDNDPVFIADTDDDEDRKEIKVNRKDVVRCEELLLNPQPYC